MLQDWLLCSLPNFVAFPIQKSMWYLTVIFMSASINLDLIKIFPQVLADYESMVDSITRDKLIDKIEPISSTSLDIYEMTMIHCNGSESDCIASRQQLLFTMACRDFYQRLNIQQKDSFRDIFSNLNEFKMNEMLNAL